MEGRHPTPATSLAVGLKLELRTELLWQLHIHQFTLRCRPVPRTPAYPASSTVDSTSPSCPMVLATLHQISLKIN